MNRYLFTSDVSKFFPFCGVVSKIWGTYLEYRHAVGSVKIYACFFVLLFLEWVYQVNDESPILSPQTSLHTTFVPPSRKHFLDFGVTLGDCLSLSAQTWWSCKLLSFYPRKRIMFTPYAKSPSIYVGFLWFLCSSGGERAKGPFLREVNNVDLV